MLGEWLREIHPEDFPHCTQSTSLVKLTKAQKEQAVLDLCSRTGSAKDVADQYGVSRISLYDWKHKLFPDWRPTQMKKDKAEYHSTSKDIEDLKCEVKTLTDEANQLNQQVHRLKLEKEALEIAAKIIKKDQGISLATLSNREKAIVIGVLRNRYSLKELLIICHLSKSSYCYQKKVLSEPDKYKEVREQLRSTFTETYESYGYRRMHLCLNQMAVIIQKRSSVV